MVRITLEKVGKEAIAQSEKFIELEKLLYTVSKDHPDYLIRFVNVKKEREVAQGYKIMMIPTQIILDKKGKEVYRHVGILEEDVLMKRFDTYRFEVPRLPL